MNDRPESPSVGSADVSLAAPAGGVSSSRGAVRTYRTPAEAKAVRRANNDTVYAAIRTAGRSTSAELVRATGLTRTATAECLRRLLRLQLIAVVGLQARKRMTTGGVHARIYAVAE